MNTIINRQSGNNSDVKCARKQAANSMKITAQDMLRFGVIDRILIEPPGGAHRDPATVAETLGRALYEEVNYLSHVSPATLRERRLKKYLNMGYYEQETT